MNADMRRPLILACIVVAGCATYQPKPVTPSQLAQSFEVHSLSSEALRAYLAQQLGHDVEPWPPPRWNREMLTLAAYYYSPALDIARAQWGTAKAGIKAAGAIPNPVLHLPFEYTTPNPGPGRPYTTGPALDIPIETAHKRGYRIDQASHLSEAARLNISNEAWKVRSQVRDALLSLYAEGDRVAFLTQKVAAQQEILEMVTKRRAVGEAAGPDVNLAVLVLTQAHVELAAARSGLLDARARVANAMGLPIRAFEAVQLDLDAFDQTGAAPPPAEARRRFRRDAGQYRRVLLARAGRDRRDDEVVNAPVPRGSCRAGSGEACKRTQFRPRTPGCIGTSMKIRQKISAGAVVVCATLIVGSASAATVSIDFSTLAQGSAANSDPNAVAGGITFAPAAFLPTLDSYGIPIPGTEHWQVDTSSSAVKVESTVAQGWGAPPSGTPNALDARLSPVLVHSKGDSITGLGFTLPNSTFGDVPPSQILFLGAGGSVLALFNFTEGVPNASDSFSAPAGAIVTDVLLASGTMYRDLSVSTVPLPAAAWLLVSGLGLLGLRRRVVA